MIKNQILCLGLTSVERQVLYCHFSLMYQFYNLLPEDLDDPQKLEKIVSESVCLFINPKKISPVQLKDLINAHEEAKRNSHVSILLFTSPFTREQKMYADTVSLMLTDLKARINRNLRDAVDMIKKMTFPCWEGLQQMKSNMFNDGWYLIDLTCTGTDPTADNVVAIDIAYMASYQIWETERIYIKPRYPLSQEEEETTGITNEMLKDGISREEAVNRLENLPHPAPFIIRSDEYDYAFIKALYHFSDRKFNHPYIAIDGLTAIVFGYLLCRRSSDLISMLPYRKYQRTPVNITSIAELYDLTLAVFENLQDRYDVRAPGHFKTLYFGEIRCGD